MIFYLSSYFLIADEYTPVVDFAQYSVAIIIEILLLLISFFLLRHFQNELLHRIITVITALLTVTLFFIYAVMAQETAIAIMYTLSLIVFVSSFITYYSKYASQNKLLKKLSRVLGII